MIALTPVCFLLIFKSLSKPLTPKSTEVPLRFSLICPCRNLSVLLFQVARAELWKAIPSSHLSGQLLSLPPSFTCWKGESSHQIKKKKNPLFPPFPGQFIGLWCPFILSTPRKTHKNWWFMNREYQGMSFVFEKGVEERVLVIFETVFHVWEMVLQTPKKHAS